VISVWPRCGFACGFLRPRAYSPRYARLTRLVLSLRAFHVGISGATFEPGSDARRTLARPAEQKHQASVTPQQCASSLRPIAGAVSALVSALIRSPPIRTAHRSSPAFASNASSKNDSRCREPQDGSDWKPTLNRIRQNQQLEFRPRDTRARGLQNGNGTHFPHLYIHLSLSVHSLLCARFES